MCRFTSRATNDSKYCSDRASASPLNIASGCGSLLIREVISRPPRGAYAYAPASATVYSGTIIYQEPVNRYGCSFTTVITYSSVTGKYSFSFSGSPQGGAGTPAVCNITASRDANTGSFTAYPVISGF